MLLIMVGGTLTAAKSFKGSVTVPQGLNFIVEDVFGPSGFLSFPAFNTEVHVNKFLMDYYDCGEVRQFHYDLSLLDLEGKEVMRKTISINDPLRYGGFTVYQTDWSLSALQIMKDDEEPFNLAMAPLKINGDKKLYGTFLPVGSPDSPDVKGISMLARDLQSIVLYDLEGKFAGIRRPNSKLPIDIDGNKIVIVDAIGSTGLDLKTDPGVPVVYAGFGFLMLTTCISFLSHSQPSTYVTTTCNPWLKCLGPHTVLQLLPQHCCLPLPELSNAKGTIIEQGEALGFYFQKYPEDHPALGFFTWRWIFALGFNHMCCCPLFLSLLALLASPLMACTYMTQIPPVKMVFLTFSRVHQQAGICGNSAQSINLGFRCHFDGIWIQGGGIA
ncbi:hypothetical protein RHMOL_Rhmol05G0090800 [Rhododendron molle]|uniref:Uncharacterized protein n=1 Tax=Rhododendron molle TaxID=49168 RepID=A0ACC0NP34_RHOML|nr:hypothetical protein RHMOL_Rhmol05G0090800 [Rhododendron molle]